MSVVTAIPSGLIQHWCLAPLVAVDPLLQCTNELLHTNGSDVETICCDGEIINGRKAIEGGEPMDIRDLVCCRAQSTSPDVNVEPAPLFGRTTCVTGSAVPLASLAATNTKNAQPYLVTKTSVTLSMITTGDWVQTETGYCLWAATSGIDMSTTTLPAAQVTTLSSTPQTASGEDSSRGRGSATGTMSNNLSGSATRSGSVSATTSPSSGASYYRIGWWDKLRGLRPIFLGRYFS